MKKCIVFIDNLYKKSYELDSVDSIGLGGTEKSSILVISTFIIPYQTT